MHVRPVREPMTAPATSLADEPVLPTYHHQDQHQQSASPVIIVNIEHRGVAMHIRSGPSTNRLRKPVLALAALALITAASCGSDDDSDSTADTTAGSEAATEDTAAATEETTADTAAATEETTADTAATDDTTAGTRRATRRPPVPG